MRFEAAVEVFSCVTVFISMNVPSGISQSQVASNLRLEYKIDRLSNEVKAAVNRTSFAIGREIRTANTTRQQNRTLFASGREITTANPSGPTNCPSEKLFVPIEMKTVTQENTSTAASNRIRDYPPESRFVHVGFVSEEFKSLVWNPSYRGQVLHHAVVFKTHHVLFVCADRSSIIYVLLVHVPENMISMYVQATTSYFFIQLAP